MIANMSGSEPEPCAADREVGLQHVVPALHLGGVPGHAQADLVADAADPGVAARVVLRRAAADQRLHRHAAADHADRGAVLGRDVVEEIREPQAAGAGHVLRHDVGIAGDVLAHVAREHARIEVVVAAGGVADQQLDGLAAVEVGDRLRVAPAVSPAATCTTPSASRANIATPMSLRSVQFCTRKSTCKMDACDARRPLRAARYDGHPLRADCHAKLAKAAGKGGRIRTRDLRVGTGCFGQAKLRPYWNLRAVSIRVLRGHNPTLFH